jgi:hypothetical protein
VNVAVTVGVIVTVDVGKPVDSTDEVGSSVGVPVSTVGAGVLVVCGIWVGDCVAVGGGAVAVGSGEVGAGGD